MGTATRCRTGLGVALCLAESRLPLDDERLRRTAEKAGVPHSTVEHIMGLLKKAGLLAESRWPVKGLVWSRSLSGITVNDILAAVGRDPSSEPGVPASCPGDACRWDESFSGILRGVTCSLLLSMSVWDILRFWPPGGTGYGPEYHI